MSGTPPPDGSPYGDPAQYPPAQYPQQQPYPQPTYRQPYPQPTYPQPPYQPGRPPAYPAYPIAPTLPQPGSMPIGPNDFGSTFKSTFGTLRTLSKPILVAVAPAVAMTAVLVGTLGTVLARIGPTISDRMYAVHSVSDFIAAVPHFWALVIAASLGYVVIAAYCLAIVAGSAGATGRAIAGDRVPTTFVVRSAGRALPRVLTWVGCCLVIAIAVGLLGLLAFVASSESSQRIAYIGIVALVVWFVGVAAEIVFVLKLGFLVPAMMLEPRSADPTTGVVSPGSTRTLGLIHAGRRSWKLTRGRVWRTFGISLVIGLLVSLGPGLVGEILNLVSSVLIVAIGGAAGYVVAYTIVVPLLIGLNLLALITQTIGQTVLYTDARIRDEGVAPAILDHAATASPADPWVRWHERY